VEEQLRLDYLFGYVQAEFAVGPEGLEGRL